jgi:lipopolysaccharide export LptBFGC system permease protein LptF
MSLKRAVRPIHLAPFGIHTRIMLASYLTHTLMVAAALMTIALTIDLWPQVALLQDRGGFLPWEIVRLAGLRLPDLLPPFLPFAVFLGVVWSESAFTESRERMLIWNSGRSPVLCLTPALIAGLVFGVAQFGIDAWLRPAAIHVQIAEKLGREGIRLDRTQSGGSHWIALPDGLLRAEIEYGPPVRLHDATIYKLDSAGHLNEVDTALLAEPLGNNQWLLHDGRYWRATYEGEGTVISNTPQGVETETPFQTRTVTMVLDTLWLGNLGLSPQYIWMRELHTLARSQIVSRDVSGYRTRLQAVFGEMLFTLGMALLGAGLAMLAFPYAVRWRALVAVLLGGYAAHFASKALYLMGEFGYINPVVAGWLPAVLLLVGVGGVLAVSQKRRGIGMGLKDTPIFAET